MILKLFKVFSPTSLMIIILLTIIFWLKVFFNESGLGLYIDQNPLPLYGLVMDFLNMLNIPFLNKLLALILVLIQAFLIAAINNQFNLIGRRSFMPSLFFILIVFNFTDYLQIHPIYFANILFLIAWIKIKKAQGKQKALTNYFDASLLIGLASLFYFNFIYLVFILWINILISRPGSYKEFSISLFGSLIIWYLFLSFYFITYSEHYNIFSLLSFNPGFTDITSLSITTQIAGIFFILLIFFANFALFRYYISLNINIRNNLKLLFYLFALGILIILFTNSSFELIYMIAIPVSLFISLFFINMKSIFLGNVLLIIAFLITITNLFFADRIVI